MKMFHIEGHFHYTVCAEDADAALDADIPDSLILDSLQVSSVWEDEDSSPCDEYEE